MWRSLRILEELGVDYELVRVDHRMDEQRAPEYTALNPNVAPILDIAPFLHINLLSGREVPLFQGPVRLGSHSATSPPLFQINQRQVHLLYLDDSGSPGDPNQKYFVLAGFSVFERQGFWLSEKLDHIVAGYSHLVPASTELHGSPLRNGTKEWKCVPSRIRTKILKDSLSVIARSHKSNRIFAVAVRKDRAPKDPVEFCVEQLCNRFDRYLRRLYLRGDPQRGMILFDKHVSERAIQNLASDFRSVGHSWGVVTNLADVPVFLDSKASRLIQLADLIAYSVFRNFEHNDSQFFDIISHRFDSDMGNVHGLVHYT